MVHLIMKPCFVEPVQLHSSIVSLLMTWKYSHVISRTNLMAQPLWTPRP